MRPMRSHAFRGKRWRVEFKKLARHYGKCDHPRASGKTIVMSPEGDIFERIDTALHEGLHAALWDLKEETVTEVAHDLTRFVCRLINSGYIQLYKETE